MKEIVLAIMFLMPGMREVTAKYYGGLILKESKRYDIDPLLLVTVIHVETAAKWDTFLVSKTNDYGLCQIHISKHNVPNLYKSPEELFNPAVNIRYGAKIMAMWKKYHDKSCANKKHYYWSHYQYGYRIKSMMWSDKVKLLYGNLRGKFRESEMNYNVAGGAMGKEYCEAPK